MAEPTEKQVDDEQIIEEPVQPEVEPTPADDALAILEPDAVAPVIDPKDAVIGDKRRELRAKDEEIETLSRQLQDLRDQVSRVSQPAVSEPASTTELSPYEKEAQSQGITMAELYPTAELQEQQVKWKEQKLQERSMSENLAIAHSSIMAAVSRYSDAAMGEGLGLKSLESLGNKFLTIGDRQTIASRGEKAGEESYQLLQFRILQSGAPEAQILRRLLAERKSQPTNSPSPRTAQPRQVEPGETADDEAAVSSATRRLTQELFG